MVVMESIHPGLEKLRSFGHGRLAPEDAAVVEEHLAECKTCCDLLENTPIDSFVGRLREAQDSVPRQFQACRPPAAVDEPEELAGHPRYRVLRLLGQGGMGAVYLAEHQHMGRSVALKVINSELLNHRGALARFRQEVRAAAKLDHPNIVGAYDADQAGSLHFLVMEYVEGQNLAAYLADKGPLPLTQACDIICQATLGLQHAHERGMVHRDIKPHNLMLTPSGQVKVLDFGLALLNDEGTTNDEEETTLPEAAGPKARGAGILACRGRQECLPHTRAGTVMGTADYIAPEQARDPHGADSRSDIYSLGCTLYHLLTSQPPFPEGTAPEKLQRHRADDPCRLSALRPEVPEDLVNVVAKMMAKRPDDRYQTAAEVATALASVGGMLSPAACPAVEKSRSGIGGRRKHGTRLAVTGLALVLISLAAAGVVRLPVGQGREIVIETDDPTVEVVVKGERIVRIVDPKTGKSYQLDRKDLMLSFADDPDGLALTLDGERPIILKRHGQRIATVQVQPKQNIVNDKQGGRLFNGKDLAGWMVDGGIPNAWSVTNGELVGMGDGISPGFLLTERVYADFLLRFEFRLSPGANSGVALRAIPGERDVRSKSIPLNLEVQILDDLRYRRPDGLLDCPTGSLFWSGGPGSYLRPDRQANLQPLPESWNEMIIESQGARLQAWVNGSRVLNTDLNKLANQAEALPGLKRSSGRIGFQHHTGQVRFRKIEIKELRPAETVLAKFLDPADWHGLGQFWNVKNGVITGATGLEPLEAHTFLCSRKKYRDFDLKFQVRVTGKGWQANSGVQIRSVLIDPGKFIVKGPQCDIGEGYWGSLWGERLGGMMKQAPWEVGAQIVKEGDFNDYFIRCVGQRVTIKVNGKTTVDDEFKQLPDEGIIAWQLHAGKPMTVTFRNLDFKEMLPEVSLVQPAKVLTPEDQRLRKFWTDYYDALKRYYQQFENTDWVEYYRKHGSSIPGGPVFFNPRMQWGPANNTGGSVPKVQPMPSVPDPPQGNGFFNGKNLFGWQGLSGYWKVHDGAIIGAPANGVKAHTFLCSEKTYKDFELRFKVRRKNGIGNTGVQIRSTLADASRFTVTGPQIEIDSANFRNPPGSIVTEPVGSPRVLAKAEAVAQVWKDDDFNDMTIRCVGKHVTVTINGVIAVEDEFPSMPDEGIIAWQLHGGFGPIAAPEEVAFKDIQFIDLTRQRAAGFVPLFNGKDMTGWKTHPDSPGDWRVENGILVGRGPRKNCLYSERGDYEDFHFLVEAKINSGGNSGQQFRKAFSAEVFGDGYEAQIDSDHHLPKTGSLFVKGGVPTVRVKKALVPVDTWFTQEVIARGNHIQILVNGKKVVDYHDYDRTWRRGHLALQLYEPETVVHFRRIEVKELIPPTGDNVSQQQPFTTSSGFRGVPSPGPNTMVPPPVPNFFHPLRPPNGIC